ncbi:TPA: replication factor C small subunit [archaeon]|nr:replication factor C small subunit [Candidatus Undinarchaeales archaeon SRR5007147.bin71]
MEFNTAIWTEKYRPAVLSEVVGQQHIVERLSAFAKDKTLQHLLFSGPAGTGKTTCALALAKETFGDNWQGNFLELNASDERGIDVVRNKVKDFARTKALGDVPYKIIYLDESDALTKEAQQALRRTMENYTHTCRFILSCNYSSKIIDPIQSRCAIFRFGPVEREELEKRLKFIAGEEKLSVDSKGMKALLEIANGDLRTAINLMQAVASSGESISEESVYLVSARSKPGEIEDCLKLAMNGGFKEARKKITTMMIEKGVSGEDVIRQMHRALLRMDEIPENALAGLLDRLGEYDFRITEGSNDIIQINAFLAQLYKTGKDGK